jgi:ribosome-binding factor A
MSVDRLQRVNEMLRREVSEALYHVIGEASFDIGAVTVTEVQASRDLRTARVGVSIRGHETERKAMLHLLDRHRGQIQALINRHMGLKYTPRLAFELDTSVEKGDHVLSLLQHMEMEKHEDDPGPETIP